MFFFIYHLFSLKCPFCPCSISDFSLMARKHERCLHFPQMLKFNLSFIFDCLWLPSIPLIMSAVFIFRKNSIIVANRLD